MWTDSHCHIQENFDVADNAIANARAAGVELIVVVGTDFETSRQGINIADANDNVYATVGLHPHEAKFKQTQDQDIAPLIDEPKVIGIGEAGLDYFYMHSPRNEQLEAFRWQIRLAHKHNKTLVIHSRDAWDDTFAVLDDELPPARTIFHCFTGGPAEAEQALARNCYVSFSGIVTFKNSTEIKEAAKLVPAGRLLIETDSPFLAPEPFRGQTNEPARVAAVGEYLAELRGSSVTDIATRTTANTRAAFSLPG